MFSVLEVSRGVKSVLGTGSRHIIWKGPAAVSHDRRHRRPPHVSLVVASEQRNTLDEKTTAKPGPRLNSAREVGNALRPLSQLRCEHAASQRGFGLWGRQGIELVRPVEDLFIGHK